MIHQQWKSFITRAAVERALCKRWTKQGPIFSLSNFSNWTWSQKVSFLFIPLIACMFVCLACLTKTGHSTLMSSVEYSSRKVPVGLVSKLSINESGWRLRKFTRCSMFVNKAAFQPGVKRLFLPTGSDRSSVKHCGTLCTSTPGHYACQGSLLHLIGSLVLRPSGSAGGKQTQRLLCPILHLVHQDEKSENWPEIKCLYSTFSLTLDHNSNLWYWYCASLLE